MDSFGKLKATDASNNTLFNQIDIGYALPEIISEACKNCFLGRSASGRLIQIDQYLEAKEYIGESSQLILNLSRLPTKQQQLIDLKFQTISAGNSSKITEVHLDLSFMNDSFVLPATGKTMAVARGIRSRLRLEHQQTTGRLFDIVSAAGEESVVNSSVNRIRYYRLNDSADGGYSRVDTYAEEMTGTLDLLFGYRSLELYRCRKFGQSFEREEVAVLCNSHTHFKSEVGAFDFD